MEKRSLEFLITGFLRSGTTLLDKLLHNFPDVVVASQPAFEVFLEVKKRYLAVAGSAETRYPLGHGFLQRNFNVEDFSRFVLEARHPFAFYRDALRVEDKRSGLPRGVLDALKERDGDVTMIEALDVILDLWSREFREAFGGIELHLGMKEVICEEFIPAFLDAGRKVGVVLRDPRAIIASVHYGSGNRYVNRRLPVLYILRQWRKSVAYALAYDRHPAFCWVRYEDMTGEPRDVLDTFSSFLETDPLTSDFLTQELRNQKGEIWAGNSSFGAIKGISTQSLDRYRSCLSEECLRYVEAICGPELRRLGYPELFADKELEGDLESFSEPFPEHREAPELDWAGDSAMAVEEKTRLRFLRENPDPKDIAEWFLFAECYDELKTVA